MEHTANPIVVDEKSIAYDSKGVPYGTYYQAAFAVRPSAIAGRGVFAMRAFTPGTLLLVYCGEVLPPERAEVRWQKRWKISKGHPRIELMDRGDGYCVDGRGSLAVLVNHSCGPNAEVTIMDNVPVIVAARQIAPGNEITISYNLNGDDPCNCGSQNCRGNMRGVKNG